MRGRVRKRDQALILVRRIEWRREPEACPLPSQALASGGRALAPGLPAPLPSRRAAID